MQFITDQNYIIKITTGEELIAKVVGTRVDGSTNKISVLVKYPTALMITNQGMNLIPSMFGADHDKEILLNGDQIIFAATPSVALEEKYNEATSPIITPSKKILLT